MKKQTGITLIALVITIIVLLILAGVSISAITGENGIVKKAKDAAEKTDSAAKEESSMLKDYEDYMNSIDADKQQRNIIVTATQTEGEDLWNSIVTLDISLEEEKELTDNQKKELVAYMLDYESYEDFEEEFNDVLGITVEDYVTSAGQSESNFLDGVIETMYSTLNYKNVERLESIGIPTFTITTPYGETLYTNILNGTVYCGFVKNGTYTFKIRSGTTTIDKTVEINNIRDFSTEAPYDIKLEGELYGNDSYMLYRTDSESEYISVENSTLVSTDDMIQLSFETPWLDYVEKDEKFFKYFVDGDTWQLWKFYIWPLFRNAFGNILIEKGISEEVVETLTYRQRIFYSACLEEIEYAMIFSQLEYPNGDFGELLTYIDDLAEGELSETELEQKYPKIALDLNNGTFGDSNEAIINFEKDTELYICLYD